MTDDAAPPPDGGRPRRRRRRRRGGGAAQAGAPGAAPETETGDDGEDEAPEGAPVEAAAPAPVPPKPPAAARPPRERRDDRPREGRPERRDDRPRGERPPQQCRPERAERPERRDRPERADRAERDRRPAPAQAQGVPVPVAPTPAAVAAARRRPTTLDEDGEVEVEVEAKVAWGTDDDGPAAAVTLAADLPADPPPGDLDPVTADLEDSAALTGDVTNVVGIRFASAGRIYAYDAGDASYQRGEKVVVEAERGVRLGTVAVTSTRRPHKDRQLKRVLRRPSAGDLRGETDSGSRAQTLLRLAKDRARALGLPIKVFRIEISGGRVLLYFTSDDRVDLRDLLRDIGSAASGRIELRQLGVRDEAKLVGGIGSCGQELCCTTWLPEFVPVSIKMAKDQGLVLNPTKVSGQCGRLKCCLVYEQATYAELRKGLPKLGKRVITAQGEGRVVEVDVLRQRVRVGYGPGESQVHPAGEVRPMFPPQSQGGRAATESDSSDSVDTLSADSARALAHLSADTPDPDASSDPDAGDDPDLV